jgi:hypothetical protein
VNDAVEAASKANLITAEATCETCCRKIESRFWNVRRDIIESGCLCTDEEKSGRSRELTESQEESNVMFDEEEQRRQEIPSPGGAHRTLSASSILPT